MSLISLSKVLRVCVMGGVKICWRCCNLSSVFSGTRTMRRVWFIPYVRIELNTRSTGGNNILKKFPPCWTKSFFFLWSGVLLSARAISDFLWTKSFFLAGLLTGTVPFRTLKTHSQMVLTTVSSATFKIALRWAGVHFTRSFKKSWFFLSRWAMLNWSKLKWFTLFIAF